ncbi:MAG TPA: hypothetical protein VJN94_04835 [Candidatus Binataceae bacterium]|nr:hypothetical protein [Candidatus Binataceae bacterium]
MASEVNRTLLVVGYGSLLSGYGLMAHRRGGGSKLIARDAFPVVLHNARRGLAKPSSHGDYLAMDLEPADPAKPIVADTRADGDGGGIGALGLEFDREWAARLSRREEYEPAKFLELLDLADRAHRPLGEFLLEIAERTRFNLLAYRGALRMMLGYTSHGYIFHPVPFSDGRVGIAAIGSGFDGSGDPAVRSKRNEFGMDRLLRIHEALKVTALDLDHDGQVGYFVECVLGGAHGLAIEDLVEGLRVGEEPGDKLACRVADALPLEHHLFLQATSLDELRYRRAFAGVPRPAVQALFP